MRRKSRNLLWISTTIIPVLHAVLLWELVGGRACLCNFLAIHKLLQWCVNAPEPQNPTSTTCHKQNISKWENVPPSKGECWILCCHITYGHGARGKITKGESCASPTCGIKETCHDIDGHHVYTLCFTASRDATSHSAISHSHAWQNHRLLKGVCGPLCKVN